MISGVIGAFGSSKYGTMRYIDSLKMMYELLQKARKEGLVALETDIEDPDKSALFANYKDFVKDHHAVAFVCDTMRMAVSGGVEVFDLDQMLDADMEVHHHEAIEPVAALSTMADALPGLGIVAAVLGVVITTGALGGPSEEIGRKVAAALVGTFLGILLCYGLVGPLAARMGKMAEEQHAFMMVLREMCVLRSRRWKRLAAAPKTTRPQRRRLLLRDKHQHADTTHHHHQEKRRPWRPSRWCLEGRLC
jgi:chemotaxis protein MotA